MSEKMSEVVIGGMYRHFKGGVYKVLAEGEYSKDKTSMISYTLVDMSAISVDGVCNCGECYPGKVCVRPKFDYDGEPGFLTEVDHEKYPDASQKMRFQLVRMPDGTAV